MVIIDKQRTASLDVDPQQGFTPLCPEELPVPGGDEIAGELNAQATLAAYRVVSQEDHPSEAPWVARSVKEVLTPVEGDYPNLDVKWPSHCVVGTRGNLLVPGLPELSEYDLVVRKGQDPLKHPYGACYHDQAEQESTGLVEWLRERQIATLVVGGLATDYCVKTTVLQLLGAGFRVVVNLGGCRGVAAETSETAIAEMRGAGAECIASSAELVPS
ncbi:MAG: nicotinamidase [Desulfuromonas sp.]|nr:MAG: nicotinamidase [Desulfuromonas sp.]